MLPGLTYERGWSFWRIQKRWDKYFGSFSIWTFKRSVSTQPIQPLSFCARSKLRCSSWSSTRSCLTGKDSKRRQKTWRRRRRLEFWILSKNGCEMAHHLISLMPTLPMQCRPCRIKLQKADDVEENPPRRPCSVCDWICHHYLWFKPKPMHPSIPVFILC